MTAINIKNIDRSEWLDLRRTGMGGSDAAAILGLNPYKSAFEVYADKLGLMPEKDDTEAMRQGRDLEDYVAKRFTEQTEKKVRRNNHILRHPRHQFMLANIDRAIVGENSGLECKTTSVLNLKRYKNGEYPSEYYCQCVHYMAVTGADKWYLAVLVLNQGFMVFEINRDEDEINALIAEEKRFWESYVIPNIPPPTDGTISTKKAMDLVFSPSQPIETEINHMYSDLLSLESISQQIKALGKEAELIRQKIKYEMKNAERATCGEYEITWEDCYRASVDKKLLLKYYPKMKWPRVTAVRKFKRFQIKKV